MTALRPTGAFATSADAQATVDPLQPTAADGWSPREITPVRSRHEGGFFGSALNFTLGGVDERPGQRLSVAQVDQLAPFFATQFGLDEGYVRGELAKVYVYVGGPASSVGQAMTIGHHVFVPDEDSLNRIMTRGGRRWLTHELAHTMQFLAYHEASPQRFLADYLSSLVVGRDPKQPGTGSGPPVWGSLFTGLRITGEPEDEIGKGATSARDRLVSTLLPAVAVSGSLAVTLGGGLAAGRATTGRQLLGTGSAMGTAGGVVAAPAITGALIGSFHEQLGDGWSKALASVAGGALAGLALWRGGAFAVGGSTAATQWGQALGRTSAIGLAAAATLGGAAIGFTSASASVNTLKGWSSSAHDLHSLQHRPAGEAPEELGYKDALHDAHWAEIDAEAIARRFTRGAWDAPEPGDPPVQGRVPSAPDGLVEKIDRDISDRLDWGVKVPLLVGIPTAVGVGAGVLGARTGHTLLKATFEQGLTPMQTLREALHVVGSRGRGIGNSLGVGASVTVAPLVAGGLMAPVAYNVTGSEHAARMAGAASGAIVSGALLTMLLRGQGTGALGMSIRLGVGMAVGAGAGLLAGGVATEALTRQERRYDTSRGGSAPRP